ncbi:MAG: hypothetical protein L6422_06175, partial [Candidatus Marinimicrobia bacterium]|nr:hypothetical protein [Candidatus Neomarinimicrobiota bacterium]
GDILFEIDILKRLTETQHDTTLVVDRGWKKRYEDSFEEHPLAPELTMLSDKEKEIEISSVGIGLPKTDSTSEFIGLAKLSKNACSTLKDLYKNVYSIDRNKKFHSAKHIKEASFIDFIQELIDRGEKVTALEIWRSWIDIDTFEDYRTAWKLIDEIKSNS